MQIPKRLSYILERDQALDGAVKLSISELEPWIKHSNLPFFPEYTKHDIDHIESVLRTASGLIQDSAWETITPSDAAVLVLSILLHDCAMHLSEDGFMSLLDEERRGKLVPGMEDRPWHMVWEEFYGEASRFDGRKLIQIFGDDQPVRRPPIHVNELTRRDRLLIGEFLRRHHPRLAQEIAIFGVPTRSETRLVLTGLSGQNAHIAQLSGIVARSHGADIRSFLPYLHIHFDVRQYKGVHPVFLMALLRVSDYLQIDAERAPSQVLHVTKLSSPVSKGEWKAHHAIKDVRNTHEDPESIFIDAFPEDVKTFFKIKQWLQGIQNELDASWAVIGEVYGRYEGLNRLGLVLRRIRSSLDDADMFAKKVSYIPIKAAFRGSDADLLKLLIEPLYGDRPEVGLRELIQNALDAVRELEQYRKDLAISDVIPQSIQECDVLVSIEKINEGEAWVVISDKGIGMAQETIIDYFLTAGASFRRSENWRKSFESNEGRSRVLRAGRFGIGALAAFLLGPKMEVSTRHVDSSMGIKFEATVDDDSFELRKTERPIGTTIKIQIPKDLADKFERSVDAKEDPYPWEPPTTQWDWYCLAKPSLKRIILNKSIPQKYTFPEEGEELPKTWRRISHHDYADILWTYTDVPLLVCNGIKIIDKNMRSRAFTEAKWKELYGLQLPNVSLSDADGRLPLNLQRNQLTEDSYPFDAVLAKSVMHDFIAYALVNGPQNFPVCYDHKSKFIQSGHPGSVRKRTYGAGISYDWYFTDEGFGYLDAAMLQKRGYKSALVVRTSEGAADEIKLKIPASLPVLFDRADSTLGELDQWMKYIGDLVHSSSWRRPAKGNFGLTGISVFSALITNGARFLISDLAFKRVKTDKKMGKWLDRMLVEEWREGGWHLLKAGECPSGRFDFKSLVKSDAQKLSKFTTLSELYWNAENEVAGAPITILWEKFIGIREIPFGIAKRKADLQLAYVELSEEIQAQPSPQVLVDEQG